MKVGIVGQRGNTRATSLVGDLCDLLRDEGVAVEVDEATRKEYDRQEDCGEEELAESRPPAVPIEAMAETDLMVSVGGDGTFLFVARGAGTTPIMGINLGEVGFLNAVPPEDARETVLEEVQRFRETGTVRTRELPRLSAHWDGLSLPPALNEIVVQGPQRGRGNGLTIEIRVDGDRYASDHADGVLVATTTGSTAYNLSEGGPLVHPDVNGMVVTEMCGSTAMPPIVVDTDRTVSVRVDEAETAHVLSDGRRGETVRPPARIDVDRAEESVFVAGPPLDFFTALGKLD
ncbi:MAG: NAD(+)/NADH kinase [Haloarculaceae archaeon]